MSSLESTALRKIAVARLAVAEKFPYFCDMVYVMTPYAITLPDGIGMAVTKDGVLLFNPTIVASLWKHDDVVTGLIHECEHLYRDHAGRRKDREPTMWNTACDAELSDDLIPMGLRLLPTDITPKTLGLPEGLLAEQYYEALQKQQSKAKDGQGSAAPPGDTPGTTKAQPQRCQCGSGAGNMLACEAQVDLPKGVTKGRDAQVQVVRETTAAAIIAAGTAPQSLKRFSQTVLKEEPIPWERLLSVSVRAIAATKRGNMLNSYTHISRRQAGLGYGLGVPIMPASVSPIPRVALVQDTSGSVSDAEMANTLSIAKAILCSVAGTGVYFLSVDAKVHQSGHVRTVRRMSDMLVGGGGTDFRPAFEHLARLPVAKRPDVVVFATDGYGTAPQHPPKGMRVIWLLQCSAAPPRRQPWGIQIVVGK